MKKFKQADSIIAVILLIILMVLTFAQVMFRFVFNLPLDWSEELIRYTLVILIYLSTVITIREGTMIRIEIVDLIIKGKAKEVLDLVIDIVNIIFMAFLTYQTTFLVSNAISVNQTSPSMGIPLAIMYGMEALLFGLMAVMFIYQSYKKIHNYVKGVN